MITPLPTPPSRATPSDFSVKADAFIAALPVFVTETNAVAAAMDLNDTTATSTDNVAIATGAKSFTVDVSKSYQPGMSVKIAHDSLNWMHGDITSYNAGTGALVVNVTTIAGAGTEATWIVTLSGPVGITGASGVGAWTITSGTFTAAPASTSTLTMTTDMTALILAGMSLKYVIGGVTYYGRVAAIAANLLTVNGAPLGGNVTALYYGGGRTRQVVVVIPGLYEDASNTALIASDANSSLIWDLPLSYLVHFKVYSRVHDSGITHGQASVRINNTEVNTTAGGELLAADATWYPTVVNIATAAYDINPGEAIEITAIKGSAGDAADLTVSMIFVTP